MNPTKLNSGLVSFGTDKPKKCYFKILNLKLHILLIFAALSICFLEETIFSLDNELNIYFSAFSICLIIVYRKKKIAIMNTLFPIPKFMQLLNSVVTKVIFFIFFLSVCATEIALPSKLFVQHLLSHYLLLLYDWLAGWLNDGWMAKSEIMSIHSLYWMYAYFPKFPFHFQSFHISSHFYVLKFN